MNYFWTYAKRMLQFKRQITIAVIAALFDATATFAGFTVVTLIVEQLFSGPGGEGQPIKTISDIMTEKVQALATKVEKMPNALGIRDAISSLPDHVQNLVDHLSGDPFWGLAEVFLIILVITIFGSIMRFIFQATVLTISYRTVMVIRKDAYHRLIHAPYEHLLEEGAIDYMSRITRDTNQLARGFNAIMGRATRDSLMSIVFLLLALIINWELTLYFMLAIPALGIVIRKLSKRIRRASKRALQAYGWMLGAVTESMQSISVVKTHNAEGYERRRFNVINRAVFAQEMKARTARVMSSPLTETIAIIGIMGVVLIAAYRVYNGGVPAAQLFNVLVMLGLAGNSVKPIAKLNTDLQDAGAAAERIDELLKLPIEKNTRDITKNLQNPLPIHKKNIQFKNVAYTYPKCDRPAVNNINLDIECGQTIAIVGPNGSGKSTVLNLLPRLWDAQVGEVLIDENDITKVSLKSLRKQIAMVTQQTFLFEGSIADNIAYGRRHTRREDIISAARAARASEFIEELEDGYDTVLGEGGSGLSGGQKQRLCIARAILRNPRILILDEATSQIDADSEYKINQALAEFRIGRTTFVIAHRLSTVIDADIIVVMVDGEIIDKGTHQELLKRCTTYQTLTHTQLQPYEDIEQSS